MGDAYERELRHLIDRRRFLGAHRWGRHRRAVGCLRPLQRLRHQPNAGREHGGADAQRTPTRRRRAEPLHLGGLRPLEQFKAWREENGIEQNLKFITQPEEVPTVLKGPGGDKWDMSYGDNVVLSDYKDLGLILPDDRSNRCPALPV